MADKFRVMIKAPNGEKMYSARWLDENPLLTIATLKEQLAVLERTNAQLAEAVAELNTKLAAANASAENWRVQHLNDKDEWVAAEDKLRRVRELVGEWHAWLKSGKPNVGGQTEGAYRGRLERKATEIVKKMDELLREGEDKQYVSKDTHLIEEALSLVLQFSPRPGNQPLQGIIDGLREFLKMNVDNLAAATQLCPVCGEPATAHGENYSCPKPATAPRPDLHLIQTGEHGYRYCPYRDWYVALLEMLRPFVPFRPATVPEKLNRVEKTRTR